MAAGSGHLTPNGLDSAWLAAKLDVLSAHSSQALCATVGGEYPPALDALCARAGLEHPAALILEPAGRLRAPLLGWGLQDDSVHGDGPAQIGACLRALPRAWRRAGLLSLAFAEDFALIDAATCHIPWLAVCLPSHWAPQDKVGRHFAEVHAPVADNALLLQASESLARLVSGPERWERFVWTITSQPSLDAHPLRHPPSGWPTHATADDLVASAWLRTEHQTFIPVPGRMQAVFTILVELQPLADVATGAGDRPVTCRALHAALATMSPAVLAYRGLAPARARLSAWLAEHGGVPGAGRSP